MDDSYDVFVSYSGKDRDWVRGWLLPRLETAGIHACVDNCDFGVGLMALDNIERAVERSRHTLLVMTPNWTGTEWCQFEPLLAQTADPAGRRQRVLPLLLQDCDLPLRLKALTWADFRDEARREDELQRLIATVRPAPPAPASNPFAWRGGITDPAAFFDREGEQRALAALLGNRQNCQIIGPRRMGKTSLLLQAQRRAPEWLPGARTALLDMQDPRCWTLAGWLRRASRQLGWQEIPADMAGFADGVEASRDRGVPSILFIDECEDLFFRRDAFAADFFLALRSCGLLGLSIVIAARRPLSDLTDPRSDTSPFYNTFAHLALGPFSDNDAADFMSIARPGVRPFAPEEKEAILRFASGHPLALQVACDHVVRSRPGPGALDAAMRSARDELDHLMPRR